MHVWQTYLLAALGHLPVYEEGGHHYEGLFRQLEDNITVTTGYPVTGNDITHFLDNTTHSLDDFIIACNFRGKPDVDCTWDKFFTSVYTKQGKCFIFNHHSSGMTLKQHRTGADFGLSLKIKYNYSDYVGKRQRISFS